jgi:hypothetical protein
LLDVQVAELKRRTRRERLHLFKRHEEPSGRAVARRLASAPVLESAAERLRFTDETEAEMLVTRIGDSILRSLF